MNSVITNKRSISTIEFGCMLNSTIFWRPIRVDGSRRINHIMWNLTIYQDKKFSTLQNFQIHFQANHHREADISISDWFRRSQTISIRGPSSPPAENIIQLYSRRWHKWHMEFRRLKRRRSTSSWLYKVSGMWNIILTSDVVCRSK